MNTRLLLVLLLAIILYSCNGDDKGTAKTDVPQHKDTLVADTTEDIHAWLKRRMATDTADICIRKAIDLVHYLDTETLSRTFTFDRYPVRDSLTGKPAPLDTRSSERARYFRTNMSREAEAAGVNFAGKYSIVSVGMTGSGEYRCIINRVTGKAYDMPYMGEYVEFRKNSNLIIIHSRSELMQLPEFFDDESTDRCFCYYIACLDWRPLYFLWKDEKLILLTAPNKLLPDYYW